MFPDEVMILLCQSYFHSEISGMNDDKVNPMVRKHLNKYISVTSGSVKTTISLAFH